MSGAILAFERADERTLPYVESLLEENDLPSSDVRSKPECFYVAYDGDERVGVGGIEVHGSAGLLRSVAVDPDYRGEGLGTALCERLEAVARDEGVEVLYLLTTTASGFFAERGYEEVPRDDAPAGIQTTTEFADLCPETAVCMRKLL